jgi:hypothetical protein
MDSNNLELMVRLRHTNDMCISFKYWMFPQSFNEIQSVAEE